MIDITSALLLLFVGGLAGFINVNAGGGSSLTLPVLIFLGLDSATANGTNRVAIFIQSAAAVHSFQKENFKQYKTSIRLSLFTLPGAIAGSLFAVKLDDDSFQFILGIVMIGIIISMLLPKKKVVTDNNADKEFSFLSIISMLLIGFYGGFIQVGVGYLLMFSLSQLLKFDLIHVNMHKVFIVFFYTVPSMLVFIITGNVNWVLGLVLATGNAFGAWWGAKLSIKKGEGLIKAILIISIAIMAAKLLNIF